ncbi:hypothetical protein [Streptomyces anulatus]|uniref:hypothetical protein n=1 Tax=Streptomyces anulatus TaxID=1892 RepID=UPI001C27D2E7|nr:hypothetical protein [Streptomyces anulatus]
MPDYRCESCRTTYPVGPDGLNAVRDRHRDKFHDGGIPDEHIIDTGARPLTGRQVLLALVVLIAASLIWKVMGALG